MSANTRKYEDYLKYLPEKERKTAEKALYTEERTEDFAMAIVRQENRQSEGMKQAEKERRNLLKQY